MLRLRKRTRQWREEHAAPGPVKISNRPAKRKKGTEEQIVKTLELVLPSEMSQNRAAETFGVPKSQRRRSEEEGELTKPSPRCSK